MAELIRWTEPRAESNCYLLWEGGGAVVVDPNDPAGPQRLLEERGWTPELILLTHEHCDHMAGLEALRARWPQARTIASRACSANLQNTRLNMTAMMEVYLTFRGKPGISCPPFVCRAADVTYDAPREFQWRGHQLRCVPLPGHTPGSAGIFFDGQLFFSGDYLIPGEEVVLRLPGGSGEDYRSRTKPFLDALPAGIEICPGHGEPYRLD